MKSRIFMKETLLLESQGLKVIVIFTVLKKMTKCEGEKKDSSENKRNQTDDECNKLITLFSLINMHFYCSSA